MFYLMMHATHFIYGYMASELRYTYKEGNVYLLNTFYLAARIFYIHHPTDKTAHTMAFVNPVMEHWLE